MTLEYDPATMTMVDSAGGGSTPGVVRTLKFTIAFDAPYLYTPGGVELFTPAVGDEIRDVRVLRRVEADQTCYLRAGALQGGGSLLADEPDDSGLFGLVKLSEGDYERADLWAPNIDPQGSLVSALYQAVFQDAAYQLLEYPVIWKVATPLCVAVGDSDHTFAPPGTIPTAGEWDVFVYVCTPVATALPVPPAIASPLDLNGELDANGDPITCVLWLDASDETTIHENDNPGFVSQWDDKSGEANHAVQAIGTVVAQEYDLAVATGLPLTGGFTLTTSVGGTTSLLDDDSTAAEVRDALIALAEAGYTVTATGGPLTGTPVHIVLTPDDVAGVVVTLTVDNTLVVGGTFGLTETVAGVTNKQPQTGFEQINALNTVTFDGVSNLMDVALQLNFPIFALSVVASGAEVAGVVVWQSGDLGVNSPSAAEWNNSESLTIVRTTQTPMVVAASYTTNRSVLREARSCSGFVNDEYDGNGTITIAAEPAPSNFWPGPHGEHIFLAGDLTETQQRELLEYAIAKWNLA